MKLFATAACLCLMVSAVPARADVTDIRVTDNAIEIQGGLNHFKYGESNNGTYLDTEKGDLGYYGLNYTSLSGEKSGVLKNFFFNLQLSSSIGTTHYDGYYQNGTPATATDKQKIYEFSTQLGRAFTLGNTLMLTPFADIGYRYWVRNLSGSSPYTERYQNGKIAGGGLLQYSPIAHWVLSWSAEGGTTFSPRMNTGGVQYDLGTTAYWQTGIKAAYAVTPRFQISAAGQMTGFGYGMSPSINGSYEPDSYTHETRALLGVAYLLH